MRKFEAIRTEIKKLSDDQRIVKPQRKQNFEGKRTTNFPGSVVFSNKYELRHLFQAYAILKGIERPKVTKKEISESKVQKIVEQYREVE